MYQPLLLLFCLIGSSLAGGPEFEKAYKTCAPKFPTVDSHVMDEFCDPSFQASDKDTKCLMKCVGEETGFSSADGKLRVDKFMNYSSPEDATILAPELTNCSALVKPDACDTAYDQWKCFCVAVVSKVPTKNPQ